MSSRNSLFAVSKRFYMLIELVTGYTLLCDCRFATDIIMRVVSRTFPRDFLVIPTRVNVSESVPSLLVQSGTTICMRIVITIPRILRVNVFTFYCKHIHQFSNDSIVIDLEFVKMYGFTSSK